MDDIPSLHFCIDGFKELLPLCHPAKVQLSEFTQNHRLPNFSGILEMGSDLHCVSDHRLYPYRSEVGREGDIDAFTPLLPFHSSCRKRDERVAPHGALFIKLGLLVITFEQTD
jgi:hypothetical protein